MFKGRQNYIGDEEVEEFVEPTLWHQWIERSWELGQQPYEALQGAHLPGTHAIVTGDGEGSCPHEGASGADCQEQGGRPPDGSIVGNRQVSGPRVDVTSTSLFQYCREEVQAIVFRWRRTRMLTPRHHQTGGIMNIIGGHSLLGYAQVAIQKTINNWTTAYADGVRHAADSTGYFKCFGTRKFYFQEKYLRDALLSRLAHPRTNFS
eukprot:jgi/Botrbrau1/23041/Bobra.136_1s0030.1